RIGDSGRRADRRRGGRRVLELVPLPRRGPAHPRDARQGRGGETTRGREGAAPPRPPRTRRPRGGREADEADPQQGPAPADGPPPRGVEPGERSRRRARRALPFRRGADRGARGRGGRLSRRTRGQTPPRPFIEVSRTGG